MAALNVNVVNNFLNAEEADAFFNYLSTVDYYPPTFKVYGVDCHPFRKIYAFGDSGVTYRFSGLDIPSVPWTSELLDLKQKVEDYTQHNYNFALVNYYQDGGSFMRQHKDVESASCVGMPIPILSFGATRTLTFKSPTTEPENFQLSHNSLLMIQHPTNLHYTHGVPIDKSIHTPRISITFRYISDDVTPPAKKMKCINEDLWMADGDWMDTHWVQYCDEDADIGEWLLEEPSKYLVTRCNKFGLRVHIRSYNQTRNSVIPSKTRGVCMTPATWNEFARKVYSLSDGLSKANGFLVNNLLSVMCEDSRVTLQQISKSGDAYEFRKINNNLAYIQLDVNGIERLLKHVPHVTDVVRNAIFTHDLRNRILNKCNQKLCQNPVHLTPVQAKHVIVKYILRDLERCYSLVYYCEGCEQGYHTHRECHLHMTPLEMFNKYAPEAIYHLNTQQVALELSSSECICNYNYDFLETLGYYEYFEMMHKWLQDGEK